MKRFYLVCNPERITFHPPTFKHEHYEPAAKEAARLARENPGQEFHVMTSIESFKKDDIKRETFDGFEYLRDTTEATGVPF